MATQINVLELFSGTGSVGNICKEFGWNVVSLDLDPSFTADINIDILKWDYSAFKRRHFSVIWASPPCNTFSTIRRTWIGRKLKCHGDTIITPEIIEKDIQEEGLPLLRKAQEIIEYFEPQIWFIENPQLGRMKDYIHPTIPYYDVDYCRYCDWGYRKRTRIWTNLLGFEPKLCNKKCAGFDKKHPKDVTTSQGGGSDRRLRYRIPPNLIRELFHTWLGDCPLCLIQFPNQVSKADSTCARCGRKMCSACECDCD